MHISKGLGFVVPIIYFVTAFTVESISNSYLKDNNFYRSEPWGVLLTGVISSIVIYAVALATDVSERPVLDVDGSKTRDAAGRHTFLSLPIGWWAPVAFAVGAAFALARVIVPPVV